MNIETEGYIYCFSNPSMPGILKIGMTEREPELRLNEANSPDTWRPPTPYRIEFVKRVSNPRQKEGVLHGLLARYAERINPRREFFRVELNTVRPFFDLMDERPEPDDEEETEDDILTLTNFEDLGQADSINVGDGESMVLANHNFDLLTLFQFTGNPADYISNLNISQAIRNRNVSVGKMILANKLRINGAIPIKKPGGERGYCCIRLI